MISYETTQYNDCSSILRDFGLSYIPSGYYWQVGEITKTEGWILHLSVIKSQLTQLLHDIIPILISEAIPFKIPRDWLTVDNLLLGGLGFLNLGKIVSVYPNNDIQARIIAKKFISLTTTFSGPSIPTDRRLQGVVYTRYGSFKPVLIKDQSGNNIKHIYNGQGQLTPDPYSVPFVLPVGISWPFADISSPQSPPRTKLLNYKYFRLPSLKTDIKGDVFRAIYFKNIFKVRTCLIKQGRHHICMDEGGRDIRDRLKWQIELYTLLKDEIPMPEILDHFEDDEDLYIVMDFIKGISMKDWLDAIYRKNCWLSLPIFEKLKVLDKLIEITKIIQKIHNKGVIHRDITATNFLLDGKEKLWLIDMELAYSESDHSPDPPFITGTPGYMSPEQANNYPPTFAQDIYALGSLSLEFLTNFYPVKLDHNSEHTKNCILYYTNDEKISNLIAKSLFNKPESRPYLVDFLSEFEQFRSRLADTRNNEPKNCALPPVSHKELLNIISAGIKGLAYPDQSHPEYGWYSIKQWQENFTMTPQNELAIYDGWHTGLAGPIWLLSKASTAGFETLPCRNPLLNSWNNLQKHLTDKSFLQSDGLFFGKAGIAMTIAAALDSNFLEYNEYNVGLLKTCLSNQTEDIDLANGAAGVCIAILNSEKYIPKPEYTRLLDHNIKFIIDRQEMNGSWLLPQPGSSKNDIFTGLSYGISGISLGLMIIYEKTNNAQLKEPILKSLDWLIKVCRKKNQRHFWTISTKSKKIDKDSMSMGIPGVALTFIKAYEVFKKPQFREMAEKTLKILPNYPLSINFTIDAGLAGLGLVYLEATRVFKEKTWDERTCWIASTLMHNSKVHSNGSRYWIDNASTLHTADLLTGNSGIIAFLIAYSNLLTSPQKTGVK